MKLELIPKKKTLNPLTRETPPPSPVKPTILPKKLQIMPREPEPQSEPVVVPTSEPDVAPTSEPEPQSEHELQSEPPIEPEPEVADGDDESEYENVLAPQLQEILEYLADDDKVFMIKGKELKCVAEIMQVAFGLNEKYQALVQQLKDSNEKITAELIQLKNKPSLPLPPAKQVRIADTPEILPVPSIVKEAPKNKSDMDKLLGYLKQYDNQNNVTVDKSVLSAGSDGIFNTFFNAIYVLNITGNGVKVAEKLRKYNINCSVIDVDFQKKIPAENKYKYFIRDAVENGLENDYSAVLLLNDNIQVHKHANDEFAEMCEALSPGAPASDWEILHLGFARRVNQHRPTTLDWEYYTEAYPELNISNEKDAIKHWKKSGFRDGRVGVREIFKDNTIDSSFAFALSKNGMQKMQKQIEHCINAKKPYEVMAEIKATCYGVRPNLFITPLANAKRPKQEYGKYQWFIGSYDA